VDILGLVVGALLGTLVMTGVMETAQAARLTRISIPFMLGAMVSERRATIRVAGFAMHLVNGLIFALGYALLFEVLDRSDWWVGAAAGALHGACGHGSVSQRAGSEGVLCCNKVRNVA
jgi:hypothetical protein